MLSMTTLLAQFVSMASMLALLLPPGWCSGAVCCQMARPASLQVEHALHASNSDSGPENSDASHKSCCLQKATLSDSQAECHLTPSSASHAANECCCTLTVDSDYAITPEKSNPPLSNTTAAVMAVEQGLLIPSVETDLPSIAGPRLHLLHCVWRC